MQSEIRWVYLGEKLGILGCSPEEARKLLFCKEIASAWREEWFNRDGLISDSGLLCMVYLQWKVVTLLEHL